jgi:16S rRNA (uracil1498-N3)-methyltransferase
MTPRLLCNLPAEGGVYIATPEQSHYLLKVLRLSPADLIELFDGRGLRFNAKLHAVEGKSAHIFASQGIRTQAPTVDPIWIMQGLPSGDKMDWIVEKAVELGVARFSPIECERSIVKLSGPRLTKKMLHWRGEIEAACMQSQRDDLMTLDEIQSSQQCFTNPSSATLKFLLEPQASKSFLEALIDAKRPNAVQSQVSVREQANRQIEPALSSNHMIILAIGPESGFSDREKWLAERAGFTSVHLGSQVLRTETAALVATAKLQAWLEIFKTISLESGTKGAAL